MKIGILVTGHPPNELRDRQFDEYDAMFRDLLDGNGFTFSKPMPSSTANFPKTNTMLDGWVITGSRHGAYEDHPWIPPLEDLIREIQQSGQTTDRRVFWPPDHRASVGGQG